MTILFFLGLSCKMVSGVFLLFLLFLCFSFCTATVYSIACGSGSFPLSLSLSSLLSFDTLVNFLGLGSARSCAYSMEEDMWVALGTSNGFSSPFTVAFSLDGSNWSGVPDSASLCSTGLRVASGGGAFVLLCASSPSLMLLDTWSRPDGFPALISPNNPSLIFSASDVVYSEMRSTWVVVGTSDASGTPLLAISRDAFTWTGVPFTGSGMTSLLSVAQGATDGFLIGGCCRTSTFSALFYSQNGIEWTAVTPVTFASGTKYPVMAYSTDNRLWSAISPDANLNINAGVRGSLSFGAFVMFSSPLVFDPLTSVRYLQRQQSFVGTSVLGSVVGDSSATTWTVQPLTNVLTSVSDVASRLIKDRIVPSQAVSSPTTHTFTTVIPSLQQTAFTSTFTVTPLDNVKYPDLASLNCFGWCSFSNTTIIKVAANLLFRGTVVVQPNADVSCNASLLIRPSASLIVELPNVVPTNTTIITFTPFHFNDRVGSFLSLSLKFSTQTKRSGYFSLRGSSTVTYSDGCTTAGPVKQEYSSSSMSVLIPVQSVCADATSGSVNSSSTSESFPVGAIIGIAVGGAVILGLVIALTSAFCLRYQRSQIQRLQVARIRESNQVALSFRH